MNQLLALFATTLFFVGPIFGQIGETTGDFQEFGGKTSVGLCALDGFGVPVRFNTSTGDVFEIGAYLGYIFVKIDGEAKYRPHRGFMAGTGFTSFGEKFQTTKGTVGRVNRNGMSFRLNYLTGNYSSVMTSISWAHETFRTSQTKQSFLFELGLRGIFPNFHIPGLTGRPAAGLQVRCQWNFFS